MLPKVCLWLTFAVLVSASVAADAADGAKVAEAPSGIAVKLTISVAGYDPEPSTSPSKATVRCVVINNGKQPVEVTLGCDGNTNRLFAGGAWNLTLYPQERRVAGPKTPKVEPKTAQVEPGAEQTVYELNLAEILLPTQTWYWEWSARPNPPRSPIYAMHGMGFVKQTGLRAEVLIGGKPHVSNDVTLKVKPPLHPHR